MAFAPLAAASGWRADAFDLTTRRRAEKLTVPEVISRLTAARLESIPGGGAEILDDGTRRRILSRCEFRTGRGSAVILFAAVAPSRFI